MANRSWKLCALFALLILPSLPLRAGDCPVLARTRSGGLVIERIVPGAPSAPQRHARILPFDKASTSRLPRRAAAVRGTSSAGNGVDTIKVVLIRVSFQTDRENALSSLSTGGGFDLTPDGTALVDPTPHGRSYFNSPMEALANYFRFQSCGRLEIVWDVLPGDEDASYEVTDPADYGPGRGGSWTIENLVRFFRAGVRAADDSLAARGYPRRFGDYDAVIVAHAGANLQSDVDGDTPNDVPSFFASLADDDAFTVDGGATTIREGAVIPETATQDGFNGGIAGVLAHEFGHQLGLPDLYNTEAGVPAVGYWDLMDSGGNLGAYIRDGEGKLQYAEGFLPGGLSAWPRTLLGWMSVDTVAAFESGIELGAVEKSPARVVRVEASSDEYFLVENRVADLDGRTKQFVVDDNGVIVGVADAGDPLGALVNGYDLLLPQELDAPAPDGGPGLLIWHVDEGLVAERRTENALNARRPFAISLLEADGVVDLGDPSSRYPLGSYRDAYYEGNQTVLSDTTLPAAWSTWKVPTGVRIDGIGARDTLMSFSARVRDVLDSKILADLGGAREAGSMVLPDGRVLVVDSQGRGWIAGTADPVFSIGKPFVTLPALVPGADGPDGVAVGDGAGYVHLFTVGGWTEPEGWPAYVAGTITSHPVAIKYKDSFFVAVTDRSDRIHLLAADGEETAGSPIAFITDGILGNVVAASDTAGDGTAVYLVAGVAEAGRSWLVKLNLPVGATRAFGYATGYPKHLEFDAADLEEGVSIVGGDVMPEEEGDEVYILCRATGRIALYGSRGLLAGRARGRSVESPPALQDLNGDSYLDLVYSDGVSLLAISPSGANLRGWPRTASSFGELSRGVRFPSPVTVIGSRDGTLVVAGSDGGLLYVTDGSGELFPGYPRKASDSFDGAVELWPSGDRWRLVYRDGPFAKWRSAPVAGVRSSWSAPFGDNMRTAWGRASSSSASPGSWTSLASDFVIYPNPSRGDRIGFHFVAPAEGTAHLEILTLMGELVLERDKRLNGGEDEFVVSMSGKASGVYLSRLVIASGGRRIEARRKFAIVN